MTSKATATAAAKALAALGAKKGGRARFIRSGTTDEERRAAMGKIGRLGGAAGRGTKKARITPATKKKSAKRAGRKGEAR